MLFQLMWCSVRVKKLQGSQQAWVSDGVKATSKKLTGSNWMKFYDLPKLLQLAQRWFSSFEALPEEL